MPILFVLFQLLFIGIAVLLARFGWWMAHDPDAMCQRFPNWLWTDSRFHRGLVRLWGWMMFCIFGFGAAGALVMIPVWLFTNR